MYMCPNSSLPHNGGSKPERKHVMFTLMHTCITEIIFVEKVSLGVLPLHLLDFADTCLWILRLVVVMVLVGNVF